MFRIFVRRYIAVGMLVMLVFLCSTVRVETSHRVRTKRVALQFGTVTIDATKPVNTFAPMEALGVGVDGLEHGDIAKVYRPANVKAMLSAGLRPLTYRLRTELGVEAWHWNPQGTWSDPARKQGYWTSEARPGPPILTCNGYALPRRGSTIDQANNKGYSRLDDGDPDTFWKSNPYLDEHYTGEPNAAHPQWVVVDFGKDVSIDTLRICWGTPWATQYKVEFWQGPDAININEDEPGVWMPFTNGTVEAGRGGDTRMCLERSPRRVRFVRVVMTKSSHIAPHGSTDVRDGLGYAIRELSLGTLDVRSKFRDRVRHGKSAATQTLCYVSSTDPWHRAADLDRDMEQPGFDRVYQSGLTNGLPMLTPVALLYDTPDNALAELKWLKARGYAFTHVEMGEEPDGQCVMPEDYGAFYVQWAKQIHALDPKLILGGPCFQATITDVTTWADKHGNRSWMNRFLRYLAARKATQEYQFFSLEWYPFDDVCAPTSPNLQRNSSLLAGMLRRLQSDGLSPTIPWMITEYGYSAFAGQPDVDLAGALLNADSVGQFLTLGGSRAYLYGYEPNTLIKESTKGDTWGNLALFQSDDDRNIVAPLATYYGATLLTQQWAMPLSSQRHVVFCALCDLRNARGEPLVSVYALRRPDRQWALLLINKDPRDAHAVRLRFHDSGSVMKVGLTGPVDLYQYGQAQYVWHPRGEHGFARPNLPPHHTCQKVGHDTLYRLPAYSLTIIRGSRGNINL